ncbi:MAG: hypothetical protein JWM76_2016 [Pseudonocardiales bacterium]|nr:hypothetical protein [Pseudonocardiales bacterium]
MWPVGADGAPSKVSFFSGLLDGVRCAGQAGIDQTVARFRDRHVPLSRALIQRLRRRREQPQLHPHSLQAWRVARCHGNVPTRYRFISGKITVEFSKQCQCRARRVGCLGNRMFTAGGNSLGRAAIYRSTNGGSVAHGNVGKCNIVESTPPQMCYTSHQSGSPAFGDVRIPREPDITAAEGEQHANVRYTIGAHRIHVKPTIKDSAGAEASTCVVRNCPYNEGTYRTRTTRSRLVSCAGDGAA